jgi:hypothetical protein
MSPQPGKRLQADQTVCPFNPFVERTKIGRAVRKSSAFYFFVTVIERRRLFERSIMSTLKNQKVPMLERFIERLPQAELHIHIEGSLEPEQMFELARRNGLRLPFKSVDDARKAYKFADLQSFLKVYYQGVRALVKTS